ncbi:hypothetical protein [Bermanella sp. R86510]|uniref:hypothetical protein n=1 Tax=unclassified Bermanella TaxID=2627862 RepID=UPI0037CB9C6E
MKKRSVIYVIAVIVGVVALLWYQPNVTLLNGENTHDHRSHEHADDHGKNSSAHKDHDHAHTAGSNNEAENLHYQQLTPEMKQAIKDTLLQHGPMEVKKGSDGRIELPANGRFTQMPVAVEMPDGSIQIKEYSQLPEESEAVAPKTGVPKTREQESGQNNNP